jgi:hypothetical protein
MKTKLLFSILFSFALAISAIAQAPAPYAEFPFDDDFDDTQGAVSAVPMGDVVLVDDDERGSVAFFPGGASDAGNYIELSTSAWGMSAVTYSLWFKAQAVETWARLFAAGTQDGGTATPNVWSTVANGRLGGNMSFTADFDFSAGPELDYGAPAPLETWTHVCLGLDDMNAKFWVDGILISEMPHNMGNLSDSEMPNIYLGKAMWPDPLFFGFMDDFRIYDKLISDEEAEAIFNYVPEPEEPAAVNDMNAKSHIYAYDGKIYIKNAANFNIQAVNIFNTAGQLMFQTNKYVNYIEANLASGVYVVELKSEEGSFKKKLAIQ